jgi:hypothetical protein
MALSNQTKTLAEKKNSVSEWALGDLSSGLPPVFDLCSLAFR